MLSLCIWIAWLLFMLLICCLTSKHILLTPQFGFIACFIPQALYAVLWVNKWNLSLSNKTIAVLFCGTGCFLITSLFLSYFFNIRMHRKQNTNLNIIDTNDPVFIIDKWKIWFLILFQLITIYFLYRYINSLPGSGFADKLMYINHTSKTVEDGLDNAGYSVPKLVSYSRSFSLYSAYVVSYLYIHSLVYKYKNQRSLLIISYILSLLASFMLGSRFAAAQLIIAFVVQFYFIYGRSKHWSTKFPIKNVFAVILVGFLFLSIFQNIGNLLGRNSERQPDEYIAVYLSAQLKNLDTYARYGQFGCSISNWQTLYSLVNFLAGLLNIPEWKHFYDQPYYYINGMNLGNVATIFYWFLHDGGFIALFIFTFTMALISHSVFHKAAYSQNMRMINMNIIYYSYVYYGLIFSFFSNRFYSSIVSKDIIMFILCVNVLKFFFVNVKLDLRRSQCQSTE